MSSTKLPKKMLTTRAILILLYSDQLKKKKKCSVFAKVCFENKYWLML